MYELYINILGVCESKWPDKIKFLSETKILLYIEAERQWTKQMDSYKIEKCVLGYFHLSERKFLVTLKGSSKNIFIIIVYIPTVQSTEDKIVSFYSMLDTAVTQEL